MCHADGAASRGSAFGLFVVNHDDVLSVPRRVCYEGRTNTHVRSLSTETVRTERASKNTAHSLSHSLRVVVSLTGLASGRHADRRPQNLVHSALLSRLFSPTSPRRHDVTIVSSATLASEDQRLGSL